MTNKTEHDSYPQESIDLHQMNRILRHRLRNLCAGVKMTVTRIAQTTSETHPKIGSRCDIIASELDNLESFTERMDLLFDQLPEPEQKSLFDLITDLRSDFISQYPFCSMDLQGPESEIIVKHGTWIFIALKELLCNAGEAAGANGTVSLSWSNSGQLQFILINNGEKIPEEIPLTPPRPFFTLRSRHDGIGLAIAYRICKKLDGDVIIDNSKPESVIVKLTLPVKEFTDG